MGMNTVFLQDGQVYAIISHNLEPRELAKLVGQEIRHMARIPRAEMRVISNDEFRALPWGSPEVPGRKRKRMQGKAEQERLI